MNERNHHKGDRHSTERITNFGTRDEDYGDVDEDKYINNMNVVNPYAKSATKSKNHE